MVKTAALVSGMHDIRTVAGSGIGSIPRKGESPYLRLHMLCKENDRLSLEYARAEKRRLSLERRMKDNRAESARLAQQSLPAQQQAGGTAVSSTTLTTPRPACRDGRGAGRRPRRTSANTITGRH